MNGRKLPSFTIWRAIFVLLMAAGAYSTYLRVRYGLGGVTNLSDQFPWGIWIGFDILCGVGLAAGGFTLVAVVHIFNIERYKPILRPAILTAFLGYVLVVLALLFDAGDVEPAFGDVRSGVVRDALHHGAGVGIRAYRFRKIGMAQAAGLAQVHFRAADDRGRHPFHAASVFARQPLPDRAA
jgi:hypothetical protein